MEEQQVATSCLVCRKRKIKCDRTSGACNNCRKFGAECAYSTDAGADVVRGPVTATDSITQAGLKRRRILYSCAECKRAKTKCSGGEACERCIKKALACFYHSPEPGVVREAQVAPVSSHLVPTWIMSTSLPPVDKIRALVDIYFARVHTVRCMGFLHIPTFMERLKDSRQLYSEDSGLIFIVCALAAPFYTADIAGGRGEESEFESRFFDAGKGWAASAMQCVFSNLGTPGVECLMTEILLHEYYLRCGDYAKGFLTSGLVARHIQVLQRNLEYDYDVLCRRSRISWVMKESRRRLVWCCYLLDAFIECGIDQLRFVSPDDIQLQLPCSEDLFMRNKPCITEILCRGELLPFVDPQLGISAADNLDLRAFYIRAMSTRSKVLKYVKNLDGEVPWETDQVSHFSLLDQELRDLEDSIPDDFRVSTENTYLFKTSGRLNLYFGLHILISQTFNDLYRIGVSNLVYPNNATRWIRENAPTDFIRRCHRMCASKAVYIASLLEELWNCHKASIIDTPYAVHTQVCSSVLVTTLASWKEPEPLNPHISHRQYRRLLQNNVNILQYLRTYIKADLYYESVSQALRRFDELHEDGTLESKKNAPTRGCIPWRENKRATGTIRRLVQLIHRPQSQVTLAIFVHLLRVLHLT
ncbi:Fungal transcriptional regulatory protein [Pleurostoma richardsiae]|uniref:Fungal transcriptional regulatory protein n=1 Tax=Pleurostoma richardsiae TaxID=41990 RepID=A0AA38VI04_9PEZI|nr:Fungal transcriptional regulatory protein [Pleurostoma richardsiae]